MLGKLRQFWRRSRQVLAFACAVFLFPVAAMSDSPVPDATSGATPDALSNDRLVAVHAEVMEDYPNIPQISARELSEMEDRVGVADGAAVVVFDVRETEEFAVSRIAGAIRMDPGTGRRGFRRDFASLVRDKHVVFYCSVGVRSTRLAARLGRELDRAGARSASNLAGGIFDWHNKGMPLGTQEGPTDYVHPYDTKWGRLLDRAEQARYEPAGPVN